MPRVKLIRNPVEDAIAEEIRRNYGGMMSLIAVQNFLGVKDGRTALRFLSGVPSYDINGSSKWRASDVAHKLAEVQCP